MKTSSSILFWAVTLTLALGSVVPTAQTCSRYICTTTALTGSQCSKADSASSPSTYYLKPCANETEVCTVRFESAPDSCAPTRSNPIRYPGEECNSTKDCYRGTCDATAKICMAANATQSCEDSVDCNPGLYCEAKVCVATKNEGADCSSKQCNVNAVCSQGKCVRIGSLPIGASSSAAAACSTFYVRDGLCAEGLTLVRSDSETGPIVCPGVCQYKNKKGEIMEEKACICGMTESNESLCNPGVGDVDPKNVTAREHSPRIVHRLCLGLQ